MELKKYEPLMEKLAYWVWLNHFYHTDEDCPKVGYLGYANGMTRAEWLTVNLAIRLLCESDKNWREYFTYDVDSSD